MTNRKLYSFHKGFLRDIYEGQCIPKYLITTMAMMLTGLFLGRHVQLWQIATIWVPINILLPSIVRRFERWVVFKKLPLRSSLASNRLDTFHQREGLRGRWETQYRVRIICTKEFLDVHMS